jgi:hypothetical protein
VTLRGGHLGKKEGKRRKLRRWIWLMYFLYKNEYKILNLLKSPQEWTKVEKRKIEKMNWFGI